MNCLPCFGSNESENNEQENSPVAQSKGHPSSQPPVITMGSPSRHANQPNKQNQEIAATDTNETNEVGENSARNFGFREMLMATKNFRRETLLGESTVGKVYKGTLRDTGQVVAVKQLDRHGTKANKEFLADVLMLSRLQHPNLVNLIGYCADGDQRILVYEYMEMGSLKNHLHEILPEREPLDWITRMKLASGAAQALEYLHEETNPPILYRNFTSSNILFDENMEPKLTDYGLVRLEIDAGNTMQQRMVCSVSCAPEYEKNGDLTKKSDVYSFGVVLLELITGRKALDTTRPVDEQNLVKWAQPYFKEPKRFPEMADPLLNGSFPDKSLNQAVGVAAMCVQDDPSVRPMISDVVAALSFLTVAPPPQSQPQPQPQIDPASATGSTNERSCSSSSSSEAEEEIDASSSQNDGTEDYNYSDSEDEDEQPMRINNKTGYNEDRGATSSSESLYNEDDYWEDESLQEETSYRSESKPKSIKRKVTIGTDKRSVIRNSSNGNNKSLKHHAGSSMRKKSVNRKSSKNNERNHVSLSNKSYGVCGDDQNSCDPYTLKNNSSSKNNEKVDVSLSNKTEDDQSSSSKQYESSKKSFSKNNNSNTHSSSRRSSVTTVPSKSHSKRSTTTKVPDKSHSKRSTTRVPSKSQSRRSQGEKLKKGESSDSSFSSDSGKNSTRFVGLDSRRKNERESESRSNNNDVEILDGGEDINARLLEDTYVPI